MNDTVYNKRFIRWIMLSLVCASVSLLTATFEKELIGFVIFFATLALLFLIPILFSPRKYIFDKEKLTIIYFFGFFETIKWTDIHSISKARETSRDPFIYNYVIHGRTNGKKAFFTIGEICANRKTKKLLCKYYKGKIV